MTSLLYESKRYFIFSDSVLALQCSERLPALVCLVVRSSKFELLFMLSFPSRGSSLFIRLRMTHWVARWSRRFSNTLENWAILSRSFAKLRCFIGVGHIDRLPRREKLLKVRLSDAIPASRDCQLADFLRPRRTENLGIPVPSLSIDLGKPESWTTLRRIKFRLGAGYPIGI